jgi:histidine phosphotransferase ChpT
MSDLTATLPTDLAALLGSRLCHDLVSPLGAIGNGVELLALSGTDQGPELALISESINNANARIRFFRVAFGAAAADQRIGRPEVESVLSDVTRGTRLFIDWQVPGDQARREVKLAFLAIQCLESAMPWGGRITVAIDGRNWSVSGSATKLKPLDLWPEQGQAPATEALSPALVQFGLLPEQAARQHRHVRADVNETEITIRF